VGLKHLVGGRPEDLPPRAGLLVEGAQESLRCGRALVIRQGPDDFLVTGIDARATFLLAPGAAGHIQVLRAEQDIYDGDGWTPEPIWNGDQTDRDLQLRQFAAGRPHSPRHVLIRLYTNCSSTCRIVIGLVAVAPLGAFGPVTMAWPCASLHATSVAWPAPVRRR